MLPDARIGQIIRQRITPQFKTGNFDAGTLLGTEAIVQVLRTQGNTLNASSASSELVENWLVPGVLSIVLLVLIVFGFLPLYPEFCNNLVASLQGLVGLVAVRGLGQSVKLQPRQSSRDKAWNLRFETIGSMRCAVCGGRLEPVASDAVEQTLRPNEKSA